MHTAVDRVPIFYSRQTLYASNQLVIGKYSIGEAFPHLSVRCHGTMMLVSQQILLLSRNSSVTLNSEQGRGLDIRLRH